MKRYLRLIIIIISIATACSGITQMVSPGFVLNIVGAEISLASKYFFAIVGMFMTLFGGMMLHALYSVQKNDAAVLWASFQKLGAAIAVGIGIYLGIFNELALGVAVFDLVSGLIFIWYYRTIQFI
ncbi:patatin [Flavihumibacter sp. R14]|nr:patatin [Flavihumibacter soli]